MTPDISIGRGDAAPPITAQITGLTGQPVDLTGASVSMRYRLIDQTAAALTSAAAIVSPATKGNVSWQPPASIPAGIYHANWVVVLSGGAQMTFPRDRWLIMKVLGTP